MSTRNIRMSKHQRDLLDELAYQKRTTRADLLREMLDELATEEDVNALPEGEPAPRSSVDARFVATDELWDRAADAMWRQRSTVSKGLRRLTKARTAGVTLPDPNGENK